MFREICKQKNKQKKQGNEYKVKAELFEETMGVDARNLAELMSITHESNALEASSWRSSATLIPRIALVPTGQLEVRVIVRTVANARRI